MGFLTRPIICICNDQFAPALRKLKQVVQVVRVDKPKVLRLSQRLKEICRNEHVTIDPHTLSALMEITDYDIRGSLNTLQFLRSQSPVITPDLLFKSASGKKDVGHGIFEIWHDIFSAKSSSSTKPTPLQSLRNSHQQKQNHHLQILGKGDQLKESPPLTPFYRLQTALYSQDSHKIVEGCFENYPNINFADPMFSKAARTTDWISFYDLINKKIKKDQSFQLQPYVNAVPLAVHKLCSASAVPKITFPKILSNVYQLFSFQHFPVTFQLILNLKDQAKLCQLLFHRKVIFVIKTPTLPELHPQFVGRTTHFSSVRHFISSFSTCGLSTIEYD